MTYRLPALACAGLFAVTAIAFAHGGNQMPQPFMERHAVMGSLAAHMKAAKAALSDKDMDAVAGQADAIYWLARIVPTTFPKGSGPELGKTRASPKIWQDWTGFEAASATLADKAAALKTAAKSDNAAHAETEFRNVAREGCGGCHKIYRTSKH